MIHHPIESARSALPDRFAPKIECSTAERMDGLAGAGDRLDPARTFAVLA
jgi:hypothetical protein